MRNLGKLFIASLIVLTSCSDNFLNTPSLTQSAGDQPFLAIEDVHLALNGVYSVLQDGMLYRDGLNNWQGFPGYDGYGDNAFNQYKWENPGRFMEGNVDTDRGPWRAQWNQLYRGISRANLVIQKLNQFDGSGEITQQQINESLGQALFLRSLFYNHLLVYWEDVPLILEPQTVSESYVPKNTAAEIHDQIVEDLTFASEHLPVSWPSSLYGYATRGAALGLFARVQLYHEVYDGPNGVIAITDDILGLGYSLHPDYAELFSEAGESSNEIVFSVRFQRELGFNNGEKFSATYNGTPKVDQRPMPNLVDDYYFTDGLPKATSALYDPNDESLNRDPRALATIYFEGDLFLADINRYYGTVPAGAPAGATAAAFGPTGYGMKKYIRKNSKDEEGNGAAGFGSQDFYVIRYADVLLMRAEAMAETGDVPGATALVNQVRARVNMPSVESVEGAVSQAEMIDIVRHERRVELALEGLRFVDLKRWGEIEAAFNRAAADPVGPYNPLYRGGQSEVFPIPQAEIDVNPNLVQHPAWQ